MKKLQIITASSDTTTQHPSYMKRKSDWKKVRDSIEGEKTIKDATTEYLPRPAGMTGDYADAYTAYIERAHFPLIGAYALQGALGIIITKLPEFNVPSDFKYIIDNATKDGQSLQQLFLNTIIEILQTGRCPLLVDIIPSKNEFRFVQYQAEHLINWKSSVLDAESNLILTVLQEAIPDSEDVFSHDTVDVQRVLHLDALGNYTSSVFKESKEIPNLRTTPNFMGRKIKEIPLFIAGSINNSYEVQPVPLLAVANCAVQIYRKEADLANSEYLSCNPTLIMTGATNDDELPNAVGSSVLVVLPDPQARVYYTKTDTAALTHVKEHINELYEEAIRHGVAILDSRKGVESAEALRIRQATQSASIYSVYLSAMTAIKNGLELMIKWKTGKDVKLKVDAPAALTFGIPEAQMVKEMVEGFAQAAVPIEAVHRYMINTGLLDQTVNVQEYEKMLLRTIALRNKLNPIKPKKDSKEESITNDDDKNKKKGEEV